MMWVVGGGGCLGWMDSGYKMLDKKSLHTATHQYVPAPCDVKSMP